MSNYKHTGLLPIYKSDQSQDWQLSGYYNNWQTSVQYIPNDVLVSFTTPTVSGTKTAPTQITLRKLNIVGGVKTIISSEVYNVTMHETHRNGQTEYYFIQSAITTNPLEYLTSGCLYEIYIEDADGNGFISNIFIATSEDTDSYIYIFTQKGARQ